MCDFRTYTYLSISSCRVKLPISHRSFKWLMMYCICCRRSLQYRSILCNEICNNILLLYIKTDFGWLTITILLTINKISCHARHFDYLISNWTADQNALFCSLVVCVFPPKRLLDVMHQSILCASIRSQQTGHTFALTDIIEEISPNNTWIIVCWAHFQPQEFPWISTIIQKLNVTPYVTTKEIHKSGTPMHFLMRRVARNPAGLKTRPVKGQIDLCITYLSI